MSVDLYAEYLDGKISWKEHNARVADLQGKASKYWKKVYADEE